MCRTVPFFEPGGRLACAASRVSRTLPQPAKPPRSRFRLRVARAALAAALLLASAAMLVAGPASPTPFPLRQPDGAEFMARSWGDEWCHGVETLDGHSIVQNARGVWEFAVLGGDGLLEPGGVRADARPPETLSRRLRPDRSRLAAPERAITAGPPVSSLAPRSGKVNVAVLLMNFADRTPTFSPGDFQNLFFGSGVAMGPGNLHDYFNEISYGKLNLSLGPSSVGGWYTAKQGHDYYGADAAGRDTRASELAREATLAAYDSGFDFSRYDADGDGYVDAVLIVHQGSGQEHFGAPSTDIWYKAGSFPLPLTLGSVKVSTYVLIPEIDYISRRIAQIGFAAHELGHVLGLVDLYDTDGSSEGVGEWSSMGTGNWNYSREDADTPVHYDAWSKSALGWLTPTQVAQGYSGEVPAVEQTPFALQMLAGSAIGGTGEYFLLENHQAIGFDAASRGSGLLIWHIDEAIGSNAAECYPGGPSCAAQHFKVALEQADGMYHLEKHQNRSDSGDPFNSGQFNGSSSPSSNLNDGTPTAVSIEDISRSAGGLGCRIAELPETVSAPRTPTYSGTGNWRVLTTSGSMSSFGHPVQYKFDWGDGTESGWLPVGTTTAGKIWSATGFYTVRALARSVGTGLVSPSSGDRVVFVDTSGLSNPPQVNTGGVVNAASYAAPGAVTPGSLISIFGTNLAAAQASAEAMPLPTELGGTRVLINSIPAPLLYVSSTQVNAQVPFGISAGQPASIIVALTSGSASQSTLQAADFAPAFFTLNGRGDGAVAALHADYRLLNAASPAAPGETVLLYCTGLGLTTPPVGDGQPAVGQPTVVAPTLTVGGSEANVEYAGAAPGFVGLYQVNATLPRSLPAGDHELILSIGGKKSQPGVTVRIQP